MEKVIRRVQAASAVLMLAISGFFGAQPAMATETNPGGSTEQPGETPSPDPNPLDPLPVAPIPGNPVPEDPPVGPTDPDPAPVDPAPAPVLVPPPAVAPVAPMAPPVNPVQSVPQVPAVPGLDGEAIILEPIVPAEPETPATAVPTPAPTPTPVATETAPPPDVGVDVAGPLKVTLAPVAENNPIVQGVTVLVLILLGVGYFRALRSKGVPRPRLNGK